MANRFAWSPEAARPFLKSAQSGFESDWGTGYHLVDPLYGASRSVDDFLVAA